MANKPLQYESLKVVLQYLEANQRFALSAHCPSIRNTERQVPLRIENLYFESCSNIFFRLTINRKMYQIGTYRCYPPGTRTPLQHQKENARNSLSWDVDRFGMREALNEVLTPGDVLFDEATGIDEGRTQETLERDLNVCEVLLSLKLSGEPFESPEHTLIVEKLKEDVDRVRSELEPFYNRRDNILAVYTTVAQLTVTCGGTQEVYHRTSKLHEMEKALFQKLFGSRNLIHVKTLLMNCSYRILRLPALTKFSIGNLKADRQVDKVIATIRKFVTETSFPLNSLEVYGSFMSHIRLKECKLAKKLILCHTTSEIFFWMLQRIENRQIEVKSLDFSPEDFKLLVQKMMETDTRRPIGTCYTFWISGFEDMGLIMKEIEELACLIPSLSSRIVEWFNRTFFGNFHSFSILICNSSSLKVSSERIRLEQKWILKLEIVEN